MAEHAKRTADVSRFTDEECALWNAAVKIIVDRGSAESLSMSSDGTSARFRALTLALHFSLLIDESDGARRWSVEIWREEGVLFSAVAVEDRRWADILWSEAVLVRLAGRWETTLLEATEHLPALAHLEIAVLLQNTEEDRPE